MGVCGVLNMQWGQKKRSRVFQVVEGKWYEICVGLDTRQDKAETLDGKGGGGKKELVFSVYD